MKPLLFQYFLEFDKAVDCIPYKEGFTVKWQYILSQPIDAAHIKRYEDSVEGKFEVEAANLAYVL
jgi:hypothetical protein